MDSGMRHVCCPQFCPPSWMPESVDIVLVCLVVANWVPVLRVQPWGSDHLMPAQAWGNHYLMPAQAWCRHHLMMLLIQTNKTVKRSAFNITYQHELPADRFWQFCEEMTHPVLDFVAFAIINDKILSNQFQVWSPIDRNFIAFSYAILHKCYPGSNEAKIKYTIKYINFHTQWSRHEIWRRCKKIWISNLTKIIIIK